MKQNEFHSKRASHLGKFSEDAQNFSSPDEWCDRLHQLWGQAEQDYQELENNEQPTKKK